jgi:hypothetical protein
MPFVARKSQTRSTPNTTVQQVELTDIMISTICISYLVVQSNHLFQIFHTKSTALQLVDYCHHSIPTNNCASIASCIAIQSNYFDACPNASLWFAFVSICHAIGIPLQNLTMLHIGKKFIATYSFHGHAQWHVQCVSVTPNSSLQHIFKKCLIHVLQSTAINQFIQKCLSHMITHCFGNRRGSRRSSSSIMITTFIINIRKPMLYIGNAPVLAWNNQDTILCCHFHVLMLRMIL